MQATNRFRTPVWLVGEGSGVRDGLAEASRVLVASGYDASMEASECLDSLETEGCAPAGW